MHTLFAVLSAIAVLELVLLSRAIQRDGRTPAFNRGAHYESTQEIVAADYRPASPYRTRPHQLTTDTAAMERVA